MLGVRTGLLSGTALVLAVTAFSTAAGEELVVLLPPMWGPIIDRVVAPAMSEKYGVSVIWQEANSSESFARIFAERGNPEFSISCPATLDFLRGREAGLWADLDVSEIENLDHIYDLAKTGLLGEDGVAVSVGGAVLQYNTDVFEQNGWDAPTSWADLARPEFRGRVGLASTAWAVGTGLLSVWSRHEGAGRGDAEPAFRFAKELVESGQVGYFPTRGSELNSAMERGEVWISPQWSEAGLQFAASGGPVDVVNPTEGTFVLPNVCAVVDNAPGQLAANQFINELLSEAAQTEIAIDRWASPVRMGLTLPEEYQGRLLLTEEEFSGAVFLDDEELAEYKPEWHDRWVREIEAAL